MSFHEWFGSYCLQNEARTTAAMRLHLASGVGLSTILRAVRKQRIQPDTAHRLATFANGAFDASELVFAGVRS